MDANKPPVPPYWEVLAAVIHLVSAQMGIPVEKLRPDDRLVEDLGIDSLDITELFMAVEAQFDIAIPDSVAESFFPRGPWTISTLADAVIAQWDTKRPAWRPAQRDHMASKAFDTVPFTQYRQGSRKSRTVSDLYRALGPNREGFAQWRRATDGMRCVQIPAGRTDAFLIDAEPVSNQAFAFFLNDAGLNSLELALEFYGAPEEQKRAEHQQIRYAKRRWSPQAG